MNALAPPLEFIKSKNLALLPIQPINYYHMYNFARKKKSFKTKTQKYIYIYKLNAIASESVSAARAAIWNSFDWFLSHAQQY